MIFFFSYCYSNQTQGFVAGSYDETDEDERTLTCSALFWDRRSCSSNNAYNLVMTVLAELTAAAPGMVWFFLLSSTNVFFIDTSLNVFFLIKYVFFVDSSFKKALIIGFLPFYRSLMY